MVQLPDDPGAPPVDKAKKFLGTKARISIALLVVYLLAVSLISSPTAVHNATSSLGGLFSSQSEDKLWPGWEGIEFMVVFGDSLTTTRFAPDRPQPSRANPLGNPAFPGNTSSSGPNWVSFLTATYNDTFLRTANLAFGGATVDDDFVRQFMPVCKSWKEQLALFWEPYYLPTRDTFPWKPENTLFAIFFGVNDVNNAYIDSTTDLLPDDVAQYGVLLDELYQTGARNFLHLNVLPLERSPLLLRKGPVAIQEEGALLREWNANLTQVVTNFTNTYSDATTFLFDAYDFFQELLDDPCSYEETCLLKDTQNYCKPYEKGLPDMYATDPECAYPLDEYFWLNPLHPTWRVHNVTAKAISDVLRGNA